MYVRTPLKLDIVETLDRPPTYHCVTDLGVGKTTLIRKVSAALQEHGVELHGFYTEEVRSERSSGGGGRGARVGFDVVTLKGERGPLARVGRSVFISDSRGSEQIFS